MSYRVGKLLIETQHELPRWLVIRAKRPCGQRMARYAENIGSTLYGDLSKPSLTDLDYAFMGFKERSYDQIPLTGLSADYVYRETKRAQDVAGTSSAN
jgi:hypothetical protein